ncbi:predicted protein [Neisseria gonorrhoeae PID1]|nr:predicted protein [Neisseria gonorrhoeae PID18]EEZ52110.1 predicted protein [Neisseria gonorrhoeae PID1]
MTNQGIDAERFFHIPLSKTRNTAGNAIPNPQAATLPNPAYCRAEGGKPYQVM